MTAQSDHRASSVDKALDILELLGETDRTYTLSEVSRTLGLAKSSAHTLLTTLERRGYLKRDTDGRFSLGQQALRFGFVFLQRTQVHHVARPFLEALSQAVGETCHMAVRVGRAAIYVEKVESPRAVRLASTIGGQAVLYASAVGKVLLAHMPADEFERFLEEEELSQLTPATITDPQALQAHLAEIRAQGYAIDDQEEHEGVRCVGAPVRDYSGKVIAAISVAGLIQRLTDERIPFLAQQVMDTAGQISQQLGYPPDES